MGVVLKIAPGYDASYPWRQIGTDQVGAKPPLEYYLAPTEKGGEPPGRWAGAGLDVLGFAEGQVIDRQVFEKLYGEHVDPRDPSGKTRLGRAPQRFASEQDVYAELAAAEPHATPTRQAELRVLAKARTRRSVPYWDITISVSKSVSLLYGGFLAKAEQVRRDGRQAESQQWDRQAGRVWAAIMKGNAAALAFLQREAGMTRTGYHRGSGAESRAELGKWEHARNWVIGTFRQHTSRAGDPQLHVHNLVLDKVQTERDGAWRKLDSKTLYRWRRAAAGIAAAEMEAALTRDLRVAWVPRADGHGREIAGVSQELMERFSARRREISEQARRVAEQRERETGRRPDAWQMARIQQDVTLRTRQHKPETPLDLSASLRAWEQAARDADLGDLAAIPDAVMAAAHQQRDREQVRDLAAEWDAVGWVARAISLEFARQNSRAPSEAEFARMERFASFITLRGADLRPVDPVLLLQGWQAQERADTEAQALLRREIALAQVRSGSSPTSARAQDVGRPVRRGLTRDEERRVMAEGVARVQDAMTTWTKGDLIAHIGESLPAGVTVSGDDLVTLAERALAGESGERVELLSAPEWPRVPDALRRADGESVFRPHGAERYASATQLGLEARLLAQAQSTGAPRLAPDTVARMLGADRSRLEAQLQPDKPSTAAALAEVTGSGLRMDQAAAAYHLLTSPRRAEVMIGPAGTGKTRTATELARIWHQAGMGSVIALTTSSNARNVIRDEAARNRVTLQAYNTAEWLGHTEGSREAGNPIAMAPGTLVILDEASMMSMPDLAAMLRRVTVHGGKVLVTGDPAQMQAIGGGGGMAMLTRRLGYVQLSEAGRFTRDWEREATLRLRDGDVTVLADYRQHDRLHAGYAEDILDDAACTYLHDRLNGQDTLLMAASEQMAAELSRRVRDDLIYWGIVTDGPIVHLRDGAHASAGDWIMARKNDKSRRAANLTGQELTNRDVLRITETDPGTTGQRVEVQRLTGRDPASGQEQWSEPFLLSKAYVWRETSLAYAVTFHAAEGRTVDSGVAVFTGDEDRQAVNTALTRGRSKNEAFIMNGWRIADPAPGSRPAPELARLDHLDRERSGEPSSEDPRQTRQYEQETAEQVLAQCLERDGQQLSATDTREAAWSDADRLDVLGAQWQAVTREASQQRYEAALREALGPGAAGKVMGDPAATWLWRSLREAEAAGFDAAGLLQQAVASRPLGDAESVAKVIDWRIRQQTVGMPALAAWPWPEQVSSTGDPDMDRYWREVAEAMADRQRRLGEHAADHPPAWAQSLGPVPEDPVGRAEWEHKAELVGKYRERWDYAHPHEPIGPKPGQHSPEARADWQAAAEILGRQPDELSELSDGQLWAWRSAFTREMAWAPPYKGDDLAVVRGEIRRADIEAGRARRNADVATTDDARQRLVDRADVLTRWGEMTRDLAERLAEAQAGYKAWETATQPTRDRAVAADAELRRRHPEAQIEPLRAQDEHEGQLAPGPAEERGPQAAASTEPTQPFSIPPEADPAASSSRLDKVARQLSEISARLDQTGLDKARRAREKAAEITATQVADDDPDAAPEAGWKDDLEARQRQAVRRQPLPRVPASTALQVLETTHAGPEAAD
jgi:hypothetical protein